MSPRNIHVNTASYTLLVAGKKKNTGEEWDVLDVTNGAIVIHTQRLKSDPGGNLLS
ncbi:hypothetical protein K5029_005052 [Escherichia coli]|nr:hypothetical protein [Escherichia coli]